MTNAIVAVRGSQEAVRQDRDPARSRFRHPRRPHLWPRRPQRRRQDHHAQRHARAHLLLRARCRCWARIPTASAPVSMKNVAFISDVASLPRFLKVRELFRMLTDIHPNFAVERARRVPRRHRRETGGADRAPVQGHDRPAPPRGGAGDRRQAAGARRADARPRHHLSQALLPAACSRTT